MWIQKHDSGGQVENELEEQETADYSHKGWWLPAHGDIYESEWRQ